MKIIITEPELTQIVRNHVLNTVSMQDGRDIAIDFSATRGADGVTATIDIPYMGVAALDLSAQPQVNQDAAAPVTVKAEKVTKTSKPAAGIFAQAQQEAAAAVAAEPESGDTSADAAEGTTSELAEAPAPTAAAASLFP